jgi:hypothetical protein
VAAWIHFRGVPWLVWDGGSFEVVRELIGSGDLPALRRLSEGNARPLLPARLGPDAGRGLLGGHDPYPRGGRLHRARGESQRARLGDLFLSHRPAYECRAGAGPDDAEVVEVAEGARMSRRPGRQGCRGSWRWVAGPTLTATRRSWTWDCRSRSSCHAPRSSAADVTRLSRIWHRAGSRRQWGCNGWQSYVGWSWWQRQRCCSPAVVFLHN